MEENNKKVLSLDYAELVDKLNAGIKMGNAQSYVVDKLICDIKSIVRCARDTDPACLYLYQGQLHGFLTALSF